MPPNVTDVAVEGKDESVVVEYESTNLARPPYLMVQPPDASDTLDFPIDKHIPETSVDKNSNDHDFDVFEIHAESLDVPKETKEGNIVFEKGRITADASQIPDSTNLCEKDSSGKQRRYVAAKDFEFLKVIGMGAFGKVLQVRHKHTRHVFAMKVISKRLLFRKKGYVENIQAERKILTRVRSPFVVTMHCSFQTREKLFIVMDFLAGGELFLRIGREGILLEKTAAFYVAEIILALDHLHNLKILHRDLKPENILLGADGHVCVTDFGLAKDFSDESNDVDDEEKRALTICGTQEYMAPEMLSKQGYGKAADYWSLGCIAYEMLKGLPPFQSNKGAKDLFSKIMKEKVKMPPGSSAAACKLLKGLLCRDVSKRLGTARSTMFEVGGVVALKQMEFFHGIDWSKLALKEVEPPEILNVSDEKDLKHFHEEFTGMALPRSVLMMSSSNYRPRHVDSQAFRGFSFIQDDFVMPERDEDEVKSYWDSVEEDGASLSDAASSKLNLDIEELNLDDGKKRPPRKRNKKKKDDQAVEAADSQLPSEANTPAVSRCVSPILFECHESTVPNESAIGSAEKDIPTAKKIIANDPVHPTPTTVAQVQQVMESASPMLTKPTPSRPVVQEIWQSSTKKKPVRSSNASDREQQWSSTTRPNNSQFNHQHATNPIQTRVPSTSQPGLRLSSQSKSASKPTPWSKAAQSCINPLASQTSSHLVNQRHKTGERAESRVKSQESQMQFPSPPGPLLRSPSSDWRSHTMTPRNNRQIMLSSDQPSWPSISTAQDPPLNPESKPSTKAPTLRGAWAARAIP